MSQSHNDDRVALTFFDELCADGVALAEAGLIAHCLRAELRRDDSARRLFVCGVLDFTGSSHLVVAREVPSGATLMHEVDIHARRRAARRQLEVDLRLDHAGTEI